MCLRCKNTKIVRSSKKKVVYKVAEKTKGIFWLPYQNFKHKDANAIITAGVHSAEGFDRGFGFCCFEYIKDAREYIEVITSRVNREFLVIIKAFIPAKTRYQKGIDEVTALPAIRAEKLLFTLEEVPSKI